MNRVTSFLRPTVLALPFLVMSGAVWGQSRPTETPAKVRVAGLVELTLPSGWSSDESSRQADAVLLQNRESSAMIQATVWRPAKGLALLKAALLRAKELTGYGCDVDVFIADPNRRILLDSRCAATGTFGKSVFALVPGDDSLAHELTGFFQRSAAHEVRAFDSIAGSIRRVGK